MDHHIRDRNRPAKQTGATFDKFRANGIERRRLSRRHHGSDARPIGGNHLFGKKLVTQPQTITVFSFRARCEKQLERDCNAGDQS